MLNLRQQIIKYLEENQTTTAINLATLFEVTIANIRYHLKYLLGNGEIEIINEVNIGQRGRPTQIYALSRKERSTGNIHLLRGLLEEVNSIGNAKIRKNKLKKLAKIICGSNISANTPLPTRLGLSVERLNELGYKARWEAHSNSPNIVFHNCPYSSLVDSFPVLCELDKHILQELLENNVTQTEKLVSLQSRHPICEFSID